MHRLITATPVGGLIFTDSICYDSFVSHIQSEIMKQHYTYNVPCTTRGMMSYSGHLFALKIYMQSTNLVIYIYPRISDAILLLYTIGHLMSLRAVLHPFLCVPC